MKTSKVYETYTKI